MKIHEIDKSEYEGYIKLLSSLEFFHELPRQSVDELLSSMTLMSINAGEVLIHPDEEDRSMYVLVTGRLQVKSNNKHSEGEYMAEITEGNIVGEISLLTGQKRSALVVAIRDCLLLKLEKHAYEKFESKNAESALLISKKSLNRLVSPKKEKLPGEDIRLIAIAPAGTSDHTRFANTIERLLDQEYDVAIIDGKMFEESFKSDLLHNGSDTESNIHIIRWIQKLERQHRYVILMTDKEMTPWSRRCLRCADYIMFVAEEGADPHLNSIESTLLTEVDIINKRPDLIYVHSDSTKSITNTHNWLDKRPFERVFHIKMNDQNTLDRIIRVITGTALGVVFNGGGAKGFAHLGVIQALIENHIPIDFIGGTSIGAIVPSFYALFGVEESIELMKIFAKSKYFDFTFPYLSILKGQNVSTVLQDCYRDIRIEDMWLPFFCVSCNLSTYSLEIEDSGSLFQAIRCSISLPCIFPPMTIDENVIIDGGVLNNLPVDVMRKKMRGGRVLAVNCNADAVPLVPKPYDQPFVSGWKLLWDHFFREKNHNVNEENMISIINSTLSLASAAHEKRMLNEADFSISINTNEFGILDFNKAAAIMKIGYETAMQQLAKVPFSLIAG